MNTTNKCALAAVAVGLAMAAGSYFLMPGIKPVALIVIGVLGAGGAFKAATDYAAKRKALESK